MASPTTESSPRGVLGPDPGPLIRAWVAFLLRLGIGLTLLGAGLAGCYRTGWGVAFGGGPWGRGAGFAALDPLLSSLPFLAIGIGLALIVGFLTTASAIAAGLLTLGLPAFAIVQVVMRATQGPPGFVARPMNEEVFATLMAASLPSLLTNAAMIWLSPLENNPFSVDALIFGRREIDPASFPTRPPTPAAPGVAEEPLRIES